MKDYLSPKKLCKRKEQKFNFPLEKKQQKNKKLLLGVMTAFQNEQTNLLLSVPELGGVTT